MKKIILFFLSLSVLWFFWEWRVKNDPVKIKQEYDRKTHEMLDRLGDYQKNVNGYDLVMSEKQQNIINRNLPLTKPGISSNDLFKLLGRPTHKRDSRTKIEGKYLGFVCNYDVCKTKIGLVNTKYDKYLSFNFSTDDKLNKLTTTINEGKLKNWRGPTSMQGVFIYN